MYLRLSPSPSTWPPRLEPCWGTDVSTQTVAPVPARMSSSLNPEPWAGPVSEGTDTERVACRAQAGQAVGAGSTWLNTCAWEPEREALSLGQHCPPGA